MASTQTDLHQFFKPQKTARLTHPLKNVKQVDGVQRRIPAEKVETPVKTTLEDEEVDETPQSNQSTPKRKREAQSDVRRKRKRESESEDPATPQKSTEPVTPQSPKSAKKRLPMENVEGEKESTEESGRSPTKQLKKDMSKLTPAEIKKKLGRCGRLDELRAKLLQVNKCGEKLREFRERTISAADLRSQAPPTPKKVPDSPQLKKFSSLDYEVPISPQKTPVKTPAKTPVKTPAFERLQYLAEKPSEELVLPFKYKVVKEIFRAVDTVVSLLHNRQEIVTYSKLKPAVQEMLRRTFHERHLGQIKTVFPLAYFYKQEPPKNCTPSNTKNSSYQLTVRANLDYKKTPATQNLASRFDEIAKLGPGVKKLEYRKMDSGVLVERRHIFHSMLLSMVHCEHQEFINNLDPPIKTPVKSIKRWHPEFPLEDLPDIEPAPLPQPPKVEKFNNARDVLEKAQNLFALNPRMEQAVKDAAAKVPPKPQAEEAQAASPAVPINTALKGVSASLLEKIRAREAQKTAREMTRTPAQSKELAMLSRLPEIARIIRNTFVSEKKAAIQSDMIRAKICASYSSILCEGEVVDHITELMDLVPEWIGKHVFRHGTYVKIDKKMELSIIIDKIQEAIKQKQRQ